MRQPGTVVVAHAVPDLLYGGLQRLTVQLARLVDGLGFESHIVVFGEVGPLAAAAGPAQIHAVPRQSRASMLWPQQVTQLLRLIRPDVVHSHSGVWYKASLAARLAGVPWLVHTDHGRLVPDPWAARFVDGLASRWTDVVVAVSKPLADRLCQDVVAKADRVRVVANGVDTDEFSPKPVGDQKVTLGIPPKTAVIGSVGRLETIKGYDVMIDAFAQYRALAPEQPAVLTIAGDGEERSALEARARALGVDREVLFLGWREDAREVLGALDLFVLTSRSEGTSVSLLEAMSSGICPVVTNVGGNANVLGSELSHRLVPTESPRAIAEGWAKAIEDPLVCRADGAAARRRVEQHFSLRAMIRTYEAIYREGLATTNPRRARIRPTETAL